jgi:hypothetical protein
MKSPVNEVTGNLPTTLRGNAFERLQRAGRSGDSLRRVLRSEAGMSEECHPMQASAFVINECGFVIDKDLLIW